MPRLLRALWPAVLVLIALVVAPGAAGWEQQPTGQDWDLSGVAVVGGTVYALPEGQPAILVQAGDGPWETRPSAAFANAAGIAATDPGRCWLAGPDAVLLSADQGLTWQVMLEAGAGGEFRSVDFLDALHGAVVEEIDATGESIVLTTADGGHTWASHVAPTAVVGAQVVAPDQLWALGSDASLLRLSAGDWDVTPLPGPPEGLSFISGAHGWVSGRDESGDPYVLRVLGEQQERFATPFLLKELVFVDATTGWAVADVPGDVSAVFASSDGGRTWQRQHTAPAGLTAIDAAGGSGRVVGRAGTVIEFASTPPSPPADETPPTTRVAGADGLWHNAPVTLTFTSSDAGGGSVEGLQLVVDDGETVTVPDSSHRLTIEAPADHSADGEHTVRFRAFDAAGNVEDWQAVVVRIDTRPPTTRALHGAGVMPGRTIRLFYDVADPGPSAGVASVSIEIATPGGRVVRTIGQGWVATGEQLGARYTSTLPAGFYTFKATAIDAAGNREVEARANVLVVTRTMVVRGFGVRGVAFDELPANGRAPLEDKLPHDALGVRMKLVNGRLYDYPGGQARFGLANLASYRATGDPFFLDRARAQAERLIQTHVAVGDAWFYPQPYRRQRHERPGDWFDPPWYGGMAQGQAMSLFSRLYEVAGETRYLEAARFTMYSFVMPGPRTKPWTVTIDGTHHLWIQEWPKLPLDNTFNGHMISSFGLYDYYRVSRDSLARLLFRAAASTALDYAPRFRRPGWISRYCLLHGTPNEKYHQVHIACLLDLYKLTGDVRFAATADRYRADYPEPGYQGGLHMAAGTHVGVRLRNDGRLLFKRTVRLARPLEVQASRRQRIRGAIHILAASGPLSGYWVREAPSRVFCRGQAARVTYAPARRITLRAGVTYTGRTYADDWRLDQVLTVRPTTRTTAHASRRAVVNGIDRLFVTDGVFAGHWIAASAVELR